MLRETNVEEMQWLMSLRVGIQMMIKSRRVGRVWKAQGISAF